MKYRFSIIQIALVIGFLISSASCVDKKFDQFEILGKWQVDSVFSISDSSGYRPEADLYIFNFFTDSSFISINPHSIDTGIWDYNNGLLKLSYPYERYGAPEFRILFSSDNEKIVMESDSLDLILELTKKTVIK